MLAVTGKPRFLAVLISSTLRSQETRIICTGVPVASTNSNNAAKAEVSAIAGFPGKPKVIDCTPSRAAPFPANLRSHGQKATGNSKGFTYSNKRLTRARLDSGKPSENPIIPTFAKSASSAICCPSTPKVRAPQNWILALGFGTLDFRSAKPPG